MKSVVVFCVIILGAGQAAAAIKNCEKLKSEIAINLTAAGISPSVLAIVDKNWAGIGTIVGSCENGTKRIVRIPTVGSVSEDERAEKPSHLSVTFAYRIKDCGELKTEIADKLTAAGVSSFFLAIADKNWAEIGTIVGSCENGTKKIVRIPILDSVSKKKPAKRPSYPSVIFTSGTKNCEELKSEIADKLIAAGVPSFSLAIVDKNRTGAGKILGRCENGTKRILRKKVP